MANDLTTELKEELYSQESGVPFLSLFILSHPDFSQTLRFVNNSEDVVHLGNTYTAFPVKIVLPPDDNETARQVRLSFDNVSLELIDEFRGVTTPINVELRMILSNSPNVIQYQLTDLKLKGIQYNKSTITATMVMDDFLSVGLTSERYTPTNFPGMF